MAVTCDICGRSFSQQFNLKRHLQVHTGNCQLVKCAECGKEFSTQYNLQRHLKIHYSPSQQFLCHICGKTFDRKDSLTRHIKDQQHPLFTCQECGKSFQRKSVLERHSICHQDVQFAGKCGKTFNWEDNLRAHKMLKVCIGKPVKCLKEEQIKKEPSVATCLATEWMKQCDICNKRFSYQSNLVRHKKSVHSNLTFACDKCGKKWTRSEKLKMHICSRTKSALRLKEKSATLSIGPREEDEFKFFYHPLCKLCNPSCEWAYTARSHAH